MQTSHFIMAAFLLLAACDKPAEQQANSGNPTMDIHAPDETPPATNDFPPEEAATNAKGVATTEKIIPAAFHGRWGMVAGDCGPDASVAKGLMMIDGAQLRFYESVGKPAVVTNPAPNRMEGRFSFSGEGMDWSKDMVLSLEGNGDRLVRTESDPRASYSYNRCPG